MHSVLVDARQAVRALTARPRFVLSLVVPLILGVGASSAVFSIVDAVLFRPLPVRDVDRLVRVYTVLGGNVTELNTSSYPAYVDYRDHVPAFQSLAAYSNPGSVNFATGANSAERVSCSLVTGNYFAVLGVGPSHGRLLTASDDGSPGAGAVVTISDRLWRRAFGANDAAVGAVVGINGRPFTIVGVAPAGFSGLDIEATNGVPDLWVPMAMAETINPEFASRSPLTSSGFGWLEMVGRLAPDATLSVAETQLTAIAEGNGQRTGDRHANTPLLRVFPAAASSIDPTGVGRTPQLAWLLIGTVACVLAVTCTVAAGLLVARAEERERGLAVGRALGASRARIARQMILEAVLVSIVSAGGGLGLAMWLSGLLTALTPGNSVLPLEMASDVLGSRVLVATLATAMLTALLAGTLPAL